MHRDRHPIGDAYLFNDQVGKIGKYGHRLFRVDEDMVVPEILFYPLFYHIAIIEPAEEPLFRSSGLYDDKTYRRTGDSTYLDKTIQNAIKKRNG